MDHVTTPALNPSLATHLQPQLPAQDENQWLESLDVEPLLGTISEENMLTPVSTSSQQTSGHSSLLSPVFFHSTTGIASQLQLKLQL